MSSASLQIALLNRQVCVSAALPLSRPLVSWFLQGTGVPGVILFLGSGPAFIPDLQPRLPLQNATYDPNTGFITLLADILTPLTASVSLSFEVLCVDSRMSMQLGVYAISQTAAPLLISNTLPLVCSAIIPPLAQTVIVGR